MSPWAAATDLAIWTLILGAPAVFAWFLVEVARLARRRRTGDRGIDPPPDEPDPQ